MKKCAALAESSDNHFLVFAQYPDTEIVRQQDDKVLFGFATETLTDGLIWKSESFVR